MMRLGSGSSGHLPVRLLDAARRIAFLGREEELFGSRQLKLAEPPPMLARDALALRPGMHSMNLARLEAELPVQFHRAASCLDDFDESSHVRCYALRIAKAQGDLHSSFSYKLL